MIFITDSSLRNLYGIVIALMLFYTIDSEIALVFLLKRYVYIHFC